MPHIITIAHALEDAGVAALKQTTRSAIIRAVKGQPGDFTDLETLFVADHLASLMSVSNLIGQYRIYDLAKRYDRFHQFNEPWWQSLGRSITSIFRPQKAIGFFRTIMPIDFDEPLFIKLLTGRAFSLAATSSKVVKQKIANVIAERLDTGKMISAAPREIEQILDSCGIDHKNGYGEMVFRTNMMESYREGGWERFNSPNIAPAFPAWSYTGIPDGRERKGPLPEKPDHHRHFRKVWPREANFLDVRGREAKDVINCRCDFIPMHEKELKRFLDKGGVMETWPERGETR